MLAAVLFAATTASSRPVAGSINITVNPIEAAYHSPGLVGPLYAVTTSASWTPDATRTEGAIIIKDLTAGGGDEHLNFGYAGLAVHSSELHTGSLPTLAGHRYLLRAKWHVYGPDSDGHGHDGTVLGPLRVLIVPKPLIRRFTEDEKLRQAKYARAGYVLAAVFIASGAAISASVVGSPLGLAFVAVGGVALGVAATIHYLSRDPIDPNFRVIAKPRIPAIPKVSAVEGLSAAAAAALNKLFAVQAQEIGLGRAILTAFNRSQGAHVKKQTVWERKQMLAAGKYAAQLATAMLSEVKLRPDVSLELDDPDLADVSVSEEDAYAFQDSLIRKGLPAQLTSTLAKLGFTRADQNQLRAQIMAIDPYLLAGSPLAAIADAKLLASLRAVAADLKSFAKKAAKNPLHTGGN